MILIDSIFMERDRSTCWEKIQCQISIEETLCDSPQPPLLDWLGVPALQMRP